MRKRLKQILLVGVAGLSIYGVGRLYYQLTAGFTIGNITSDFAFNPNWEVRPLTSIEKNDFQQAINQPYHYLGKGCQSYVFESQDGQYVVKFFKYQRYRLLPWLEYFPALPAVVQFRQEKCEKKWRKLDGFVRSWKVAFENLKEETGLIFVHLNKTTDLHTTLVLRDKLGFHHQVNLDEMEFCVQRKAEMLCDTILAFKKNNDLEGAKQLMDRLLSRILSEYQRGLGDNDHALMQNTGVAQGWPVHIDVGQFVIDQKFLDPRVVQQELFTKTYKFKLWLREEYPELAAYLEQRLVEIIGPRYLELKPIFRQK